MYTYALKARQITYNYRKGTGDDKDPYMRLFSEISV